MTEDWADRRAWQVIKDIRARQQEHQIPPADNTADVVAEFAVLLRSLRYFIWVAACGGAVLGVLATLFVERVL